MRGVVPVATNSRAPQLRATGHHSALNIDNCTVAQRYVIGWRILIIMDLIFCGSSIGLAVSALAPNLRNPVPHCPDTVPTQRSVPDRPGMRSASTQTLSCRGVGCTLQYCTPSARSCVFGQDTFFLYSRCHQTAATQCRHSKRRPADSRPALEQRRPKRVILPKEPFSDCEEQNLLHVYCTWPRKCRSFTLLPVRWLEPDLSRKAVASTRAVI